MSMCVEDACVRTSLRSKLLPASAREKEPRKQPEAKRRTIKTMNGK